MREYVAQKLRQKAEADERLVRSLLERWVSGLEPSLVMRDGEIIGLCDADAEVGSKPYVLLLNA